MARPAEGQYLCAWLRGFRICCWRMGTGELIDRCCRDQAVATAGDGDAAGEAAVGINAVPVFERNTYRIDLQMGAGRINAVIGIIGRAVMGVQVIDRTDHGIAIKPRR